MDNASNEWDSYSFHYLINWNSYSNEITWYLHKHLKFPSNMWQFTLWQDGAAPLHYHLDIGVSGWAAARCWRRHSGPTPWPPRSLDLSQPNFFWVLGFCLRLRLTHHQCHTPWQNYEVKSQMQLSKLIQQCYRAL